MIRMTIRLSSSVCLLALAVIAAGCGDTEPTKAREPVPTLNTANDPLVPRGGLSGAHANYLSRPTSLKSAAVTADAAVIATVTAVADGAPIVAAPDEVNPTVLVTLQVRDRWRGDVPNEITIRWLGTPRGGFLEGDPPYELGQDYVLLLKSRTDGPWYRPEAPDGRLQIVGERVRPVIEGAIADEVKNRSVADVKQIVVGAK